MQQRSGPLAGLRIVEFAGLGPAPFACMLLADLGADIVRIDRPSTSVLKAGDITSRGRRSVGLDLKSGADLETARALIAAADVVVEGFRPGVMERLGLGPDAMLAASPKLVYARMTGWGQEGPLAHAAGHDINYIALSGALAAIGPAGGKPVPPLNLVGDFGGGALYLVVGILAARMEAQRSGRGQVVDCAMVDGAISLMTFFHTWMQWGLWDETRRGANILDGGAPYYATYECSDGKFVSVGAIEPQFYAELRRRAGLDDAAFDRQNDTALWPDLSARIAAVFITRTQAEWSALLEGTDVCFAPVLTMSEAARHPHVAARGSYLNRDGVMQSAPAPRFSRTPGEAGAPPLAFSDAGDILRGWSVS